MWPLHLSVARLARLIKRISAVVPGACTHGWAKNSASWVGTEGVAGREREGEGEEGGGEEGGEGRGMEVARGEEEEGEMVEDAGEVVGLLLGRRRMTCGEGER